MLSNSLQFCGDGQAENLLQLYQAVDLNVKEQHCIVG